MKDLLTLAVYTVLTIGAILLLVAMSRMDNLPSSAVVITATLLVVVLPVLLAVKAGKKEQAKRLADKPK